MNPIDDVTVCITSFRRAAFLDRAITSCWASGVRRISIAAVEPDAETLATIEKHRDREGPGDAWISYDVARVDVDVGCNNTWLLAAYRSRTPRIVLLHDDDALLPEFEATYRKTIGPIMDGGIRWASWRAHVLNEDRSRRITEYFSGPTRVMPSRELDKVVVRYGTLSLSPVVSILDRETLIHAAKEAEATLTHNDCLYRPGMLLGTEILVYIRHTRKFPMWLYVDEVLSLYGSHAGSGTVNAEKGNQVPVLARGYDRARTQGVMRQAPEPRPKLILVHCPVEDPSADDRERIDRATPSWRFHFGSFDAIELPVTADLLKRTGRDVGDTDAVPYIRDLIDLGCSAAMPEDVVVFANSDVGLTVDAAARIIAGVNRGRGVCVCPRRSLLDPAPGRLYRTVKNCKVDGGMDVIALTPSWWKLFREQMPDMLVGREAWDLVFRTLAEEWSDGGTRDSITVNPEDWWRSKAYCDDVCWHKPHASRWKLDRRENAGGKHNRTLAREFFFSRKNLVGVRCVEEPSGFTVRVEV